MYIDPVTRNKVVKRLLAMEGDVVTLDDPGDGGESYTRMPSGQGWMEGDGREWSIDSRNHGPVPLGLIQSVVIAVIWPWWRMKLVDRIPPSKEKVRVNDPSTATAIWTDIK